MFDTHKFAEELRVAIARANVPQRQVAGELGIDPTTLSLLCNGHRRPNAETQARITAWLERVEK